MVQTRCCFTHAALRKTQVCFLCQHACRKFDKQTPCGLYVTRRIRAHALLLRRNATSHPHCILKQAQQQRQRNVTRAGLGSLAQEGWPLWAALSACAAGGQVRQISCCILLWASQTHHAHGSVIGLGAAHQGWIQLVCSTSISDAGIGAVNIRRHTSVQHNLRHHMDVSDATGCCIVPAGV